MSFVLNRKRRNFADRDCELLDRIGPFLRRLFRGLGTASGLGRRSAERALQSLTPREREVHRWVAADKTDRAIAVILECSPRTVHKHLQRIYEKLGIATRTASKCAGSKRLWAESRGAAAAADGTIRACPIK